jgi:Uma2 family endonuclease
MPPSNTLIPVEEYLQTSYKPACEYRDGVLTQKPMPTYKHSHSQFRINLLLYKHCPDFEASPELSVRLNENRFLVPDVAVQRKDRIQQPYPTEPIHLCIEILSPEDRLSEVIGKAEEYHAWGVEMVWIVDPVNNAAWEFSRNRPLHEVPLDGALTAPEIAIPLAELFSGL